MKRLDLGKENNYKLGYTTYAISIYFNKTHEDMYDKIFRLAKERSFKSV